MAGFALPVMISIVAVALMVWSAKNSHGGAYQKHNPHPSHFLAYLSYALALAAWGLTGSLFLIVIGLYFVWKSFLAFRAWRRDESIEL